MKNMGKTDKLISSILGLFLVGIAVYFQLTSGKLWWLAIPGIVFLLTSAISICPAYIPFKFSTDKKD